MLANETIKCELPASGFTRTLDEVYDWAQAVVDEIKKRLGNRPIKVDMWAYREQGAEWLAADFHGADDPQDFYGMTFVAGETHSFSLVDISVPDMAEALHMVGILADALGAEISIGRRGNELNRYCVPTPWEVGQTNGVLALR